MTCRELTEVMTEYLEGALPRAGRLRVWAHLVLCASCRALRSQMLLTVRALGSLPSLDPGAGAVNRLRGAYAERPGP